MKNMDPNSNIDDFEESEFEDLSKKELDPRLGYVFKLETMPVRGDVRSFRVKCYDKEGVIAGSTHIYQYPDHLKAAEVLVGHRHRRQGIAQAMYRQAEKYTGLKMVPSGVMTPDGKALWAGMAKSWKGAVAGLAMMVPGATTNMDAAPVPQEKPVAVKNAFEEPPEALHPHLRVISQLESSGGKYMDHGKGPNEYWTAYGELGIKPAFGHDEWKRNLGLKKRFPGLEKPEAFTHALRNSPAVYNAVANAAWSRLLSKFGNNPRRAAYAWNQGEWAEIRDRRAKRPSAFKKHPYVTRFTKLLGQVPIAAKSEEDVAEPLNKSLEDHPVPQGDDGRYDYSHILPEALRDKYRLLVDEYIEPAGRVQVEAGIRLRANPEDELPYDHHIGLVQGMLSPNKQLHIISSSLHKDHRDQGLGTLAYEAVMAHAHNRLGATHAGGGVHSSLSHAVHKRLAAKHGLKYSADRTGVRLPPPPGDEPGAHDDAFDGYEYELR
jgi:ribosomal protein S18 acetylase RimI-like enzyme